MKKEIRKALLPKFTDQLKISIPGYTAFKEKSVYLFPGERAFWNDSKNGIREWIIFSPDPKALKDAFTIEVGWSKLNRFPQLGMRPSGLTAEDARKQELDEYIGRLSQFWSSTDPWWSVKKIEDIDTQVSESIQCILDYWIPHINVINRS